MSRERHLLIGLGIGGVVVVIATIVFSGAFGARNPPSYPDVADRPEPALPGTIAFTRLEPGSTMPNCIYIRAAAGGPEAKLGCTAMAELAIVGLTGGSPIRFAADGRVEVPDYRQPGDFSGVGARVVVFDPTGAKPPEIRRGLIDVLNRPVADVRADGATVGVTTVDGCCRVVVRQGGEEDRTVLKVTDPGDYFLNDARWSPDGRWILVADNLNRVIVMVAEGDPKPRILLRDAALLSLDWLIPT